MKALLVIFHVLGLAIFAASKLQLCNKVDDETFCKKYEAYNKDYPPKSGPIIVQPTVKIKEITRMNEERQSVSILADIVQEWIDTNLTVKNPQESWYKINDYDADVWISVIYIINVQEVKKITTVGTKTSSDLWIYPESSNLWFREIVEVTFACDIKDYSDFPIDKHFCNLVLQDRENSVNKMLFNQSKIEYDVHLLTNSLESLDITDTTTRYDFKLSPLEPFTKRSTRSSIAYHATGIKIQMRRKNLGSLISTFYIPTATFTFASMISFMIKPEIVPGRMGMIVTLLLISSTVYNAIDAPQNRGLSYAEIWIIGSQIPIVFALVEYGLILTLTRNGNQSCNCLWIDIVSGIADMIFYVGFNIYYWFILMMS